MGGTWRKTKEAARRAEKSHCVIRSVNFMIMNDKSKKMEGEKQEVSPFASHCVHAATVGTCPRSDSASAAVAVNTEKCETL